MNKKTTVLAILIILIIAAAFLVINTFLYINRPVEIINKPQTINNIPISQENNLPQETKEEKTPDIIINNEQPPILKIDDNQAQNKNNAPSQSPEPINKPTVSTNQPSNPLENKPDVNPVNDTNPIRKIQTNPFE